MLFSIILNELMKLHVDACLAETSGTKCKHPFQFQSNHNLDDITGTLQEQNISLRKRMNMFVSVRNKRCLNI